MIKKQLKQMKQQILFYGILSTLFLSACGPSNKEKQALINTLSTQEKQTAQINYDKELLYNLNELQYRGYCNYLAEAHQLTMNTCIPCKDKNAPMHYFLTQHAQHRLNEARTQKTYTETEIQVIYNVALKMFMPTPVTVTKTKYIYCSFFPQKLEQIINTSKNSTIHKTPQQMRCPDCQRIKE